MGILQAPSRARFDPSRWAALKNGSGAGLPFSVRSLVRFEFAAIPSLNRCEYVGIPCSPEGKKAKISGRDLSGGSPCSRRATPRNGVVYERPQSCCGLQFSCRCRRNARNRLIDLGIPATHIRLSSASEGGAVGSAGERRLSHGSHESFWGWLFGSEVPEDDRSWYETNFAKVGLRSL